MQVLYLSDDQLCELVLRTFYTVSCTCWSKCPSHGSTHIVDAQSPCLHVCFSICQDDARVVASATCSNVDGHKIEHIVVMNAEAPYDCKPALQEDKITLEQVL